MMAFVNASSTIGALASIQDDLHVAGSTLLWVTSSFTLALVSLVMPAGTLGELYGRRRLFVGGVVLFACGSLIGFLAGDVGVLIAGQVVMGVGAAAILPCGLAMVSTSFPDPAERTKAISVWASCAGLGLAVGPLVAGLLLTHFSWRSVYLPNLVLGIATAVLALFLLPESRHPSRRLDPLGVVLGTITVAAATFAIIQGGASGYAQPYILAAYAVTLVVGSLFLRVEANHRDPMLDLKLFRSASFSTVMLIAAAAMFGFVGIALLSVLQLQRVAGHDSLGAGIRLMPMMLSYVVVGALSARILRVAGFRLTLTAGLVLLGGGALALMWTDAGADYSRMWPGLLLAGIGSALLVAPSTAAAVNSVSPLQAGMASATVNLFRQLGAMLGPAVLGTIATSRFPALLSQRLVDEGVPRASAGELAAAAAHGQVPAGDGATLALLTRAVPEAYSEALHTSFLTGAVVLLVIAVFAAIFVRTASPSPIGSN